MGGGLRIEWFLGLRVLGLNPKLPNPKAPTLKPQKAQRLSRISFGGSSGGQVVSGAMFMKDLVRFNSSEFF